MVELVRRDEDVVHGKATIPNISIETKTHKTTALDLINIFGIENTIGANSVDALASFLAEKYSILTDPKNYPNTVVKSTSFYASLIYEVAKMYEIINGIGALYSAAVKTCGVMIANSTKLEEVKLIVEALPNFKSLGKEQTGLIAKSITENISVPNFEHHLYRKIAFEYHPDIDKKSDDKEIFTSWNNIYDKIREIKREFSPVEEVKPTPPNEDNNVDLKGVCFPDKCKNPFFVFYTKPSQDTKTNQILFQQDIFNDDDLNLKLGEEGVCYRIINEPKKILRMLLHDKKKEYDSPQTQEGGNELEQSLSSVSSQINIKIWPLVPIFPINQLQSYQQFLANEQKNKGNITYQKSPDYLFQNNTNAVESSLNLSTQVTLEKNSQNSIANATITNATFLGLSEADYPWLFSWLKTEDHIWIKKGFSWLLEITIKTEIGKVVNVCKEIQDYVKDNWRPNFLISCIAKEVKTIVALDGKAIDRTAEKVTIALLFKVPSYVAMNVFLGSEVVKNSFYEKLVCKIGIKEIYDKTMQKGFFKVLIPPKMVAPVFAKFVSELAAGMITSYYYNEPFDHKEVTAIMVQTIAYYTTNLVCNAAFTAAGFAPVGIYVCHIVSETTGEIAKSTTKYIRKKGFYEGIKAELNDLNEAVLYNPIIFFSLSAITSVAAINALTVVCATGSVAAAITSSAVAVATVIGVAATVATAAVSVIAAAVTGPVVVATAFVAAAAYGFYYAVNYIPPV